MPDKWEARHGLDAKKAFDGAADADKDGYTNLEEFLNGTDPGRKDTADPPAEAGAGVSRTTRSRRRSS